MRVGYDYLVKQAVDAAFPGLPHGMSGEEAQRRISAAVSALLPFVQDGESDAYDRGRSSSAAERECVQLRAERDQALTLLRQVRSELLDKPGEGLEHRGHCAFNAVRLLDASGLLDDEGQQR